MKCKYSDENYELNGNDFYRHFDFNWDNINSFEDFKKANLVLLKKNNDDPDDAPELFMKWIKNNPDFDKYFMMLF